ncbi:PssE/Cps14G family polysaccharide biosynthesis glycosyltransferase [Pedobacter alpinus]|uniref:PssE/Cps14G family polysaccharide biosynthesis glycosyltransferase n=1 Tax=Pedobacter alpinus TaxID=1590643 RepID=A0ABW5TVF8_9SPHI
MILVLLGTFKIEFSRPILAIENAIKSWEISEEIIVQAGHTAFKSDFMTIRAFIEPKELDNLYERAEIIVTHGGVGSILRGFRMKKKIIAIPRLHKFKEHVDDHQIDILEEFARLNYLIPWYEHDKFADVLAKARKFEPSPFVSTKKDLEGFLVNYIDNL